MNNTYARKDYYPIARLRLAVIGPGPEDDREYIAFHIDGINGKPWPITGFLIIETFNANGEVVRYRFILDDPNALKIDNIEDYRAARLRGFCSKLALHENDIDTIIRIATVKV